ncbi:MAG: response regulator [Verrucomicrobiota bacterium]
MDRSKTHRPTMNQDAATSLLIVEDDPNLRALLKFAAERAACFDPISTAANGEEALHAIHQGGEIGNYPDLVISDLSMPRMTGLELLRALKSDEATRAIPLAIVTSSNIPNDREDALAAGACVFEHKPLGLDAFMRLFREIRAHCCEMPAGVR